MEEQETEEKEDEEVDVDREEERKGDCQDASRFHRYMALGLRLASDKR